MTILIEQTYFQWLRDHVETPHRRNGLTWEGLLAQLHSKEFVWTVPNDDNRLHDAADMRQEFSHEYEVDTSELLLTVPISVLEIIVVLSRHIEFQIDGKARQWAWQLIENMGLGKYSDPVSPRMSDLIDDHLEVFIWRNYPPNGEGGLFPLKLPPEDQRRVELWFQMHAWIDENYAI